MDAAVVVVNYASSDLLRSNRALREATGLGLRVVVVDNLSTAEERRVVGALADERGWLLIERPNDGFGSGVDAGVIAASALGDRTVILLNPDADTTAEVLSSLVSAAEAEPDALIAPSIRREDGSVWFEAADLDLRNGRTRRVPGDRLGQTPNGWLTGACLAMSVDVWRAAGGFDHRYFMYWEDIDFSFAVRERGRRLVSRPDLVVVHSVGGTQASTIGRSPLYYRYNCRGRLMFAALHLPPAARLRWVLGSPAYAYAVLRRGVGRRDLLRLGPRRWWGAARGTIEGVFWICAQSVPSSARNSRDHLRSAAASSTAANAPKAP